VLGLQLEGGYSTYVAVTVGYWWSAGLNMARVPHHTRAAVCPLLHPGPTAVINCWLLIVYFSRSMIVDCHIIQHCLALSPLLASLQHTPPRPPEHSWSPWWDCKGKCRRNELSIAAYLFFNPIHPTVDCYVTPNHRHLHRRCSITVSNMLTIADAGVGIRRAHLSSYLRW